MEPTDVKKISPFLQLVLVFCFSKTSFFKYLTFSKLTSLSSLIFVEEAIINDVFLFSPFGGL